jgi:hypothetical protein
MELRSTIDVRKVAFTRSTIEISYPFRKTTQRRISESSETDAGIFEIPFERTCRCSNEISRKFTREQCSYTLASFGVLSASSCNKKRIASKRGQVPKYCAKTRRDSGERDADSDRVGEQDLQKGVLRILSLCAVVASVTVLSIPIYGRREGR